MANDSRGGLIWRASNFVTVIAVWAALLFCLFTWGRGGVIAGQSQALEYKDFVSILLTVLGIMIGLAALLLAVLAIWGFEHGRKLLIDSAQARVDETLPPLVRALVAEQVPGVVEDQIRFLREGAEGGNPDEIAKAFSEEP